MRYRLNIVVVHFLVAVIVAFMGAGRAFAAPDLSTRTSMEAAVTVKATPTALSGDPWKFDLAFDTHSRALTDDLQKSARLVTDDGKTYSALGWRGDPPGGHHRKGVLEFKAIAPLPASIELQIMREGEPQPRTFKWSLK
jgi:hypothetical protein